jgi:hypothetical protein
VYEIKGYSTDHYDKDVVVRTKDHDRASRWIDEFLSVPGRKVVTYCLERKTRWGPKHWRKVEHLCKRSEDHVTAATANRC